MCRIRRVQTYRVKLELSRSISIKKYTSTFPITHKDHKHLYTNNNTIDTIIAIIIQTYLLLSLHQEEKVKLSAREFKQHHQKLHELYYEVLKYRHISIGIIEVYHYFQE